MSEAQAQQMAPHPLVVDAGTLRTDVQNVADKVSQFKKRINETSPMLDGEDKGEQMANVTLAYRHLEDAKMRLGKVIQYVEGRSCYDK